MFSVGELKVSVSREYFELIEEANHHLQYPMECDDCGYFTNDIMMMDDGGDYCVNCHPPESSDSE